MKKNAELAELTFPESGVTVHLPVMSAAGITMKLRRKYPPPSPPQQVVDYGGGHKVREFNYAHPDYKEAQEQYGHFINQQTEKTMMSRAVRSISLNAQQREMVAKWKKENAGLYDDDDREQEIFFEEFCLHGEEDLIAFIKHVSGYDPSEADTADAVAGF